MSSLELRSQVEARIFYYFHVDILKFLTPELQMPHTELFMHITEMRGDVFCLFFGKKLNESSQSKGKTSLPYN